MTKKIVLPERKVTTKSNNKIKLPPITKVVEIVNPSKYLTQTKALFKNKTISFYTIDLETTGLDAVNDEVVIYGISYVEANLDTLDVNKFEVVQVTEAEEFQKYYKEHQLEDELCVFANAKFDTKFIKNHTGLSFNNVADTKILTYLYDPREKQYGLKHWVKKVFNVVYDVDTEVKIGYSKENLEYNKLDLQYTSLLFVWCLSKLSQKEYQLHKYLTNIEFVYQDILDYGVLIDTDKVKKALIVEKYNLEQLEHDINNYIVDHAKVPYFMLGDKRYFFKKKDADGLYTRTPQNKKEEYFNINSSKQLVYVLYTLLKYPVTQYTDTGNISAGKNALKDLNNELGLMLLDYKSLSKLINSFIKPLSELKTDRIHPEFGVITTLSGRTSCKNPNLQQIPREGELSNKQEKSSIRKMFKVPDDSYYFVEMDYSQAELRCASHLGNIKNMREAYEQGMDLHDKTAQLIVGRENITKQERTNAKIANFGILYGMQPPTLALSAKYNYGVDMSLQEATDIHNNFFKVYPELNEYNNGIRKEAQQLKYIESPVGRRLRVLNKGFSPLSFNNAKVQGLASDILLLSLLEISELPEHGVDFRLVGSVHDSILMYIKKDKIDIVHRLKTIMENPRYFKELNKGKTLNVPIVADVDVFEDCWYGNKVNV